MSSDQNLETANNTLIIPAAGESTRFPDVRPKWLLTTPDGRLMLEAAVSGLKLSNFKRIVVTCLREHIERYTTESHLKSLLCSGIDSKLELCILENKTASQVETVANTLIQSGIDGPFFVKDCDNFFTYDFSGNNEIAVVNLNNYPNVSAPNKSYVKTDQLGAINNIVEKFVISNKFCCGGYGFKSPKYFLEHWKNLEDTSDLYLSTLIFSMILRGHNFQAREAYSYEDWGTLKDYQRYCAKHLVVFCDVDGVLFENSSKFDPNGWSLKPLNHNINALKALQQKNIVHLIITTSRPEAAKEALAEALKLLEIEVHQFVMNLPHSSRILINDYSKTNPYPSAEAINIERNSENLELLFSRYLSKTEPI